MKAIEVLKTIFPAHDLCVSASWIDASAIEDYRDMNFGTFYYIGKAIENIANALSVDCLHLTRRVEELFGEPIAEFGNDRDTFYLYEIEA